MKPTFRQWLAARERDDTPIGGLAYDVANDCCCPKRRMSQKSWRRYLRSRQVCPEALAALDEAWQLYREQIKLYRWEQGKKEEREREKIKEEQATNEQEKWTE